MHAKKAKFETYINQGLSSAIALGAGTHGQKILLRTATGVLCISQALLTLLVLDKRRAVVLVTYN